MKTTKRVSAEQIVTSYGWTDDRGVFHSATISEPVLRLNDISLVDLSDKPIYSEDGYQIVGYKKDIAFATDAKAVGEVVDAIVKTRRGEMQLDVNRGIPYFDAFESHAYDVSLLRTEIERAISSANGVKSLTAFDYSVEKEASKRNILSYHAQIKTVYSDETISLDGSVNPSEMKQIPWKRG